MDIIIAINKEKYKVIEITWLEQKNKNNCITHVIVLLYLKKKNKKKIIIIAY